MQRAQRVGAHLEREDLAARQQRRKLEREEAGARADVDDGRRRREAERRDELLGGGLWLQVAAPLLALEHRRERRAARPQLVARGARGAHRLEVVEGVHLVDDAVEQLDLALRLKVGAASTLHPRRVAEDRAQHAPRAVLGGVLLVQPQRHEHVVHVGGAHRAAPLALGVLDEVLEAAAARARRVVRRVAAQQPERGVQHVVVLVDVERRVDRAVVGDVAEQLRGVVPRRLRQQRRPHVGVELVGVRRPLAALEQPERRARADDALDDAVALPHRDAQQPQRRARERRPRRAQQRQHAREAVEAVDGLDERRVGRAVEREPLQQREQHARRLGVELRRVAHHKVALLALVGAVLLDRAAVVPFEVVAAAAAAAVVERRHLVPLELPALLRDRLEQVDEALRALEQPQPLAARRVPKGARHERARRPLHVGQPRVALAPERVARAADAEQVGEGVDVAHLVDGGDDGGGGARLARVGVREHRHQPLGALGVVHQLARRRARRHRAEHLDGGAQHLEGQRRVRAQQRHQLRHVAVEGDLVGRALAQRGGERLERLAQQLGLLGRRPHQRREQREVARAQPQEDLRVVVGRLDVLHHALRRGGVLLGADRLQHRRQLLEQRDDLRRRPLAPHEHAEPRAERRQLGERLVGARAHALGDPVLLEQRDDLLGARLDLERVAQLLRRVGPPLEAVARLGAPHVRLDEARVVLERRRRVGLGLLPPPQLQVRLGAVAVQLAQQVVVDPVRRRARRRDAQRLRVALDRRHEGRRLEGAVAARLGRLDRLDRLHLGDRRRGRRAVLLHRPAALGRHRVRRLVRVEGARRLADDEAALPADDLAREAQPALLVHARAVARRVGLVARVGAVDIRRARAAQHVAPRVAVLDALLALLLGLGRLGLLRTLLLGLVLRHRLPQHLHLLLLRGALGHHDVAHVLRRPVAALDLEVLDAVLHAVHDLPQLRVVHQLLVLLRRHAGRRGRLGVLAQRLAVGVHGSG